MGRNALRLTEEEESVVFFLIDVLEMHTDEKRIEQFVRTSKSAASVAFLRDIRDRLWGDLCVGAPPVGFNISPEYAVLFIKAVADFRHHWRKLVVEGMEETVERGQRANGHRLLCTARQVATLLQPIADRLESALFDEEVLF